MRAPAGDACTTPGGCTTLRVMHASAGDACTTSKAKGGDAQPKRQDPGMQHAEDSGGRLQPRELLQLRTRMHMHTSNAGHRPACHAMPCNASGPGPTILTTTALCDLNCVDIMNPDHDP
eukprot:1158309-Pelagomonas_calceolata.AAC.17